MLFHAVPQLLPTRAAGKESKNFCFPFCEKLMLSQVALNDSKSFSSRISRATSVFASFFNLQTQALKLSAFAKR